MTVEVETFTGNDLDRLHRSGYPVTLEPLEALHRTMQVLERAITPAGPTEAEFYPYVSLNLERFLAGMQECDKLRERRAGGPKFLDVGCGIGTKAIIAHYLGWDPAGLDHHQPYLDVARRLIPSGVVHLANAFDWSGYGAYDLIYSWRPCVLMGQQADLWAHIARHASSGALLFFPNWESDIPGTERVGEQMWRVV